MNQEFADSDIGSDIELVDQFRNNLVAAGADSEAPISGCEDLPPWGGEEQGYGHGPHACSASEPQARKADCSLFSVLFSGWPVADDVATPEAVV